MVHLSFVLLVALLENLGKVDQLSERFCTLRHKKDMLEHLCRGIFMMKGEVSSRKRVPCLIYGK